MRLAFLLLERLMLLQVWAIGRARDLYQTLLPATAGANVPTKSRTIARTATLAAQDANSSHLSCVTELGLRVRGEHVRGPRWIPNKAHLHVHVGKCFTQCLFYTASE